MKFPVQLLAAVLTLSQVTWAAGAADNPPSARFEISFPAATHDTPITGRLFLLISHEAAPEPRLQSMWFNSPEIVAIDVSNLAPDKPAVIDGSPLGTPLKSLSALPPGDYYVQAVLNIYTQFHRSDGHTLWAHNDQGEGQEFNKSPGNLFSPVQKIHIDGPGTFAVSLSEVIPPIVPPADTEWVKHIKIRSEILSRFWGQPIELGAVVLLPRGYAAEPSRHYPVIYYQPEHFRAFPPFEFTTDPTPLSPALERHHKSEGFESGYEFYQAWQSKGFPRMIAISLQTPTPLSDWSGAVDSINNGPYAQAVMSELIPRLEAEFRTVREPYARVLTGKHSGGRAALALQLQHAAFFGGAWVLHPWPFNFERWGTLNIYDHDNAYRLAAGDIQEGTESILGWMPLERYAVRSGEDVPFVTLRQLGQHDAVMASVAGGDPIGADDAINGPVGEDGYPRKLWDRESGQIDHEVAEYWRQHGDLAYYTQQHWSVIGAHLVDKLHFYISERDFFYRNQGVRRFQEFLKTTRNPHYEGNFLYSPSGGSWQPMRNAQLVRMMAKHIAAHAPSGADLTWK